MEYFKGLFPGALDISLEEVERSGSEWRITFGYTTGGPLTLPSDIVHSLRGLSEKAYKVVTINANTGEALSVKIRRP
jgi:hypothetical protein